MIDKELLRACRAYMVGEQYRDALDAITHAYREDRQYCRQLVVAYRSILTEAVRAKERIVTNMDLLREAYLLTARDNFSDYCIFMEWDRPVSNRFYQPRMKQLAPVVEEMQRLEDGYVDLLCVSLPPGVGKSAVKLFFLTHLMGRNPKDGILETSHSHEFLAGEYAEVLRMLHRDGEYNWHEVFPERRVTKTNAESLKIDIGQPQRFSSLQMGSIGSGLAGKVRAVQLLSCDDLVSNIEEAQNKERLDKLYNQYVVDLKQRKQGDHCAELHLATRWSVHDIIGRLEEENRGNTRAKFISIPALDKYDHSNFDYGGSAGFTTDFYQDMRRSYISAGDEASWRALYMNEPIERDGMIYDRDSLRYYYELPEGEPDAILAVCDPAEGGGDDTAMPVFAVYGSDHYMIDAVCSAELPEVTDDLLSMALVRNNVHMAQFESNAAGGRTADKVEEKVRAMKGRCRITKKRTTANKLTKIIVNSPWVKEHCLFLDDSVLKKDMDKYLQYIQFMSKLRGASSVGKMKHDDVPDVMAQYALYVQNMTGSVATVVKRPF